LVQPNDHVTLVARTGRPSLCVGRQSCTDRRVGFRSDRNADHGTAGQRGLPPQVYWVSDVRRSDNRSAISGEAKGYDDSARPRTMRRRLRLLDNCLPRPGFGQQGDAGLGVRSNTLSCVSPSVFAHKSS
jgi:hypothetical protein